MWDTAQGPELNPNVIPESELTNLLWSGGSVWIAFERDQLREI